MCDHTTTQRQTATEFEYAVKNALAAAARTTSQPDKDTFKTALDRVMSAEYQRHVAPLKRAVETADNPIARRANQQALDAAKDELSGMFAAGFARLNKAWDALQNGTITFQRTQFDPETDNDGPVDATAHGVEAGDEVIVMVSHKQNRENSRYVLLDGDDSGHRVCTGWDKQQNDDFPICKHEMTWILYQVTAPFVPVTDSAVDALQAPALDADAATIEVEAPHDQPTPTAD